MHWSVWIYMCVAFALSVYVFSLTIRGWLSQPLFLSSPDPNWPWSEGLQRWALSNVAGVHLPTTLRNRLSCSSIANSLIQCSSGIWTILFGRWAQRSSTWESSRWSWAATFCLFWTVKKDRFACCSVICLSDTCRHRVHMALQSCGGTVHHIFDDCQCCFLHGESLTFPLDSISCFDILEWYPRHCARLCIIAIGTSGIRDSISLLACWSWSHLSYCAYFYSMGRGLYGLELICLQLHHISSFRLIQGHSCVICRMLPRLFSNQCC